MEFRKFQLKIQEITFQRLPISKLSGEACPRPPLKYFNPPKHETSSYDPVKPKYENATLFKLSEMLTGGQRYAPSLFQLFLRIGPQNIRHLSSPMLMTQLKFPPGSSIATFKTITELGGN